jgi:hypothetical protein
LRKIGNGLHLPNLSILKKSYHYPPIYGILFLEKQSDTDRRMEG